MAGSDPWQELKYRRGQRFTHVGELRRTDGSAFTGKEAFDALDRVRLGLNLALGRRVSCALPVGYQGPKAVWCRWRSAPIDWFQNESHWLDETIAHEQVRDVLALVLDFTSDVSNLAVLRDALGYYVAGNVDVDVHLSVSIPVSALQMLAYYRFVTRRHTYSKSAWERLQNTEEEIRLLLDDLQVNTQVQPHFQHLEAARARTSSPQNTRDALGAVMKMRNVVTHPTRDSPTRFSVYEWAEAAMHVRYWLCLACLHTVGYTGKVARILQPQARWTGDVANPPWVP
jgi:hypothetical protein